MNTKTEKYHTSLFSRQTETFDDTKQTPIIPQTSLYDTPIQYQMESKQKYVTVFGFTQQNREAVLDRIRKTAIIEKKEEGRNYIDVWAEDPSKLDDLLKLNYKVINGEIIGVFRRNFGAIEDEEIYVKKKGILKIISEYLFGE